MRIWYVVMLLCLTDLCAQNQFRAARPDASSSMSLVAPSDAALIALIRQLVCGLKMNLTDCCAFLASQIDAIEVDVEDRIGSIVDTFGDITGVDQAIQNMLLVLSIIDTINNDVVVSLIDIIESSGSSFDQIVSQIDGDVQIDQTIVSYIDTVDSQLDFVQSILEQLDDQDCQSVHEVILSQIESISSDMDSALLFAGQILPAHQTISSLVDKIDTQFDAVASVADILVADACQSSSDEIASRLAALQEQEAQCCANLSSQIDAIGVDADTRLETIESILDIIANFSLDGSRVSTLVSVIELIENNGLDLFVESSFDHVSSQIESLQACGSIALSAAGTISTPGSYCLTQDITGDIIIAASNVSLDLNGFTVTGNVSNAAIFINAGLQHISVTNGYIEGSFFGIEIDTPVSGAISNDISISDITVNSTNYGIFVVPASSSQNVTNLYLSDLTMIDCSQAGYFLQGCQGFCVNCTARQSAVGFDVAAPYLCFTLKNAQALGNDIGYLFSDNTPNSLRLIIADSCTAFNNTGNGFQLEGCNVGMYNCISSANTGNGFYISNVSASDSTGLISGSSAIANTLGGFIVSATTTNIKFTGNYSADNKLLDTNIALPINYGYSGTKISTQNSNPYWWAYWNSTTADKWTNANGSNPT